MWGKMWKDVVNVNCQISNKSVSKIGEVVDLQGRGRGNIVARHGECYLGEQTPH